MSQSPIEIYNEAYLYYTASKGYPLNRRKAVALFQEAAALGVSQAMNYLGVIYEAGECVPQDLQAAATWYYKAYQADGNNLLAKYNLGRIFLLGKGVTEDYDKAETLLTQVAHVGVGNNPMLYGKSCYYLGSLMYGKYKDHAKAYAYFVKAAKYANEPDAWYGLGCYVDKGFYPSNYNDPDGKIVISAENCYEKAASQGFAPVQHALGQKLLKINNVELGTKYIEKAADQGYEPAIKTLKILKFGDEGLSGLSKSLVKKFLNKL